MRVAVVGGGVNGVCCAIQILEHLRRTSKAADVTIISEAFSPNTTGDGSAGLWGPFLLGGTPQERVHKWSKSMHDFLEQLWLSEDAGEAGICLFPVVRLTTSTRPMQDFWKDIVYGARQLTREQLNVYSDDMGKRFTSGLHFVTYTSEPAKLLPYLMKRFESQGGRIVQRRISDLKEVTQSSDYDAIINCTGLGAREVVQDKQMYPVRGQVSRVRANWMYCVLLDESDDGNYVIPNSESVVLGGTHQEEDYNVVPTTEDKDFIIKGCRRIVPGLEHAQHLFDWVGLRPGRDELRLEVDSEERGKIVVHNYGHGGSGVTLAWGCAEDVLELLQTEMKKRNSARSKL